MRKYNKPTTRFIPHRGAENLYKLEAKRDSAIQACAKELQRLAACASPADYWGSAIPQALYDVLASFDPGAAIIAAEAYLASDEVAQWRSLNERPALVEDAPEVDPAAPVKMTQGHPAIRLTITHETTVGDVVLAPGRYILHEVD